MIKSFVTDLAMWVVVATLGIVFITNLSGDEITLLSSFLGVLAFLGVFVAFLILVMILAHVIDVLNPRDESDDWDDETPTGGTKKS